MHVSNSLDMHNVKDIFKNSLRNASLIRLDSMASTYRIKKTTTIKRIKTNLVSTISLALGLDERIING